MIMSFLFVVDTPVTEGTLLLPVAWYGNPLLVSKGLVVFAPDMANATAESPFDESPLENVTVIIIEPPAVKGAHHSEIRS
jgi:hypothetical protein